MRINKKYLTIQQKYVIFIYIVIRWGGFLQSKKYEEYLSLTDEELVALSQAGDEPAFNVLASRYLNTRFADSTSAYLDRDDFVQEGMFGFLNAVRTYNANKGVYFNAYAHICMKNSINTAASNASDDLAVDNDSEIFNSLQGDKDPLGYVITSERLSEVLSVCEVSLSKLEKTVLYMKAVGMSYKEIGEKLSMDPKSCDNAVQRARNKLKKVID